MRAPHIIALALLFSGTPYGLAQMNHTEHASGMKQSASGNDSPSETATPSVLTEPGQGAFAALSEVVRVLEADPGTDWSRVDITGLRDHLLDMDRLVMNAQVVEVALPDGLKMTVTGDSQTIATLQRMVPAHAAQLARDDRWIVTAKLNESGAVLSVTSNDATVAARIQGLGFFGLMASQDHHREHHMLMARGEDAHVH